MYCCCCLFQSIHNYMVGYSLFFSIELFACSTGWLYRSRHTSSDKNKPKKGKRECERFWNMSLQSGNYLEFDGIEWVFYEVTLFIFCHPHCLRLRVPPSIHCINLKWFFCNKFQILIHSLYGYLMSHTIKDVMIIICVCYFNTNKFHRSRLVCVSVNVTILVDRLVGLSFDCRVLYIHYIHYW